MTWACDTVLSIFVSFFFLPVALMQSMSSVSLLAMATSKPHGPSLGTETSSVATGDFSSGLSVMRPYVSTDIPTGVKRN